jgi:DNA polymerase III delta prime subunit
MKQLWKDKYRPKTVTEYAFSDENLKAQVEYWIKNGSIPQLLLSGSPGTGKTTLARVLINELGVDQFDIMDANGSKEARKIDWM